VIPRQAYPSSVYCFLSSNNFQLAIRQWLGFILNEINQSAPPTKKFNLEPLTIVDSANQIYSDFMEILKSIYNSGYLKKYEDKELETILRRTVEYRDMKRDLGDRILDGRTTFNAPCPRCASLGEDQKCRKDIYIKKNPLDPSLIGQGVSFASPENQIEAIPGNDLKEGQKPVILHPSDPRLQLEEVTYDEDIIQRCGIQIFKFYNQDEPTELMDFWVYNIYPPKAYERLLSHHQGLQELNLKKIKRGAQFQYFSQGSMVTRGFRAAMGGGLGDAYTMYSGMDALDCEGIEILFNDAETSMILSEGARMISFEHFAKLDQATTEGDRLGTSGATSYSCNNYTAPLHSDDDIVPGICAQYQLQARKDLKEYAFIYGDYRKYVVARSNSLWSFSGSTMHGTMLPSTLPLRSEDITLSNLPNANEKSLLVASGDRDRVSNGDHRTKTRKNNLAAQKYQTVRACHKQIYSYWD
ncbi:hypothetical protein GALMADRAFT_81605, partial [Galerina marginata CBS 339.88]